MARPRRKPVPLWKRQKRALKRWSPVQKGPLPPLVARMFMSQAQGQAAKWAQPRQKAINTYTTALSRQLAPIAGRVGGYYGQAQQGQAASDAALSAMLAGQGQQIAGDLSSQLAAAGQSTGGLQAGQVGQGTAGAAYALGSANLGRLLAQGAAAQSGAAQLPGIARLGGLQHTRELQGMAQQQAQQFYQSNLDRELEKWISRTGLGTQQAELGLGKAQLGEQRRQFNVSAAQRRREHAADVAAEMAEMTKEQREKAKKQAWKVKVPAARRQADALAGRLRGKVGYYEALRRVRRLLNQRVGQWVSDAQMTKWAKMTLVRNGIHKPGSPGGGGPVGEPGPKTPIPPEDVPGGPGL